MSSSIRSTIADFLTRQWYLVLLAWVAIAVTLRLCSPAWDSVVRDGDFEFLPASSPSRLGQAMLRQAFPDETAKSQMVIVMATEQPLMTLADQITTLDISRRLTYATADIAMQRMVRRATAFDSKTMEVEHLRRTIDSAISFDERWFDAVKTMRAGQPSNFNGRLVELYRLRQDFATRIGDEALATSDEQAVETLSTASDSRASAWQWVELPESVRQSIQDIWTWNDPVLAKKLGAKDPTIKVLSMQIREEFMAVQNVAIMNSLQSVISDCAALTHSLLQTDAPKSGEDAEISAATLQVEITGPAAVGADLLAASKRSVDRSEGFAIWAVVLTLLLIYRSPLLIFLPLVTIGLSLSISVNVLSWLAYYSQTSWTAFPLVELYSTTRVFLVVLIFGIGTDLTLFLIVRCRETDTQEPNSLWRNTISESWLGVWPAIMGSGLTTTIGLSMMAFSDFAKFRYSGISIAISLLITLMVCLTFPTAALAGLGPLAFWPARRKRRNKSDAPEAKDSLTWSVWFWRGFAGMLIKRPGLILTGTLLVLLAPAIYGLRSMERVTYNLVGELSENGTSRRGQKLIQQHLPHTETSAITLCVVSKDDFDSAGDQQRAIEAYRKSLYIDGVRAVQAISDPLGDFPPKRTMSLLSSEAWRRRLLQRHPLTRQKFVSQTPQLALKVARFDIVTAYDPFSESAAEVLQRLVQRSGKISQDPDSRWYESTATISGTTAGIVDLKHVTQADQTRVQILVVISVFIVLLILIRQLELSVYLMASVLLSYFTTLGITFAVFRFGYGAAYEGLDWKVPLFLFVILVAVGQDYNIYLATRVAQEQRSSGRIAGLFKAIVNTGGIITSCGLIMFATFSAMCLGGLGLGGNSSALASRFGWTIPTLRGITELGFSLSFGILLDTFLIRTIVVPAYIAWRKLSL